MARTIADKLDFLMNLTGTRNSQLGRALSFDPSYISRIRSGERGLPREHPFVEPAATFFAKAINKDHQQSALLSAMGIQGDWPKNFEDVTALIASWLANEEGAPALHSKEPLANVQRSSQDAGPALDAASPFAPYYGVEGKRGAVASFLKDILASGKPANLLLYSDEDMEWLIGDPEFTALWGQLIMQLVASGSTIHIAHTVSRDYSEMTSAVQEWLPLYATGAVRSSYYPRLRDGIAHRSLFVAPGHSAVTSNSIANGTGESLTLLVREPGSVKALECELQDFFALCRPLVQPVKMDGAQTEADMVTDLIGCTLEEAQVIESNDMRIVISQEHGIVVFPPSREFALFTKGQLMTAAFLDYFEAR